MPDDFSRMSVHADRFTGNRSITHEEDDATQASREQHINRALQQYRERHEGVRPSLQAPIRDGAVLEVINVPLDVPVLNTNSFRIAPRLADHPLKDEVLTDPDSAGSQAIVAQLVRESHRQASELKDSLADEGQDQPGVITRKGKLLNANTRCVLLRELVEKGRLPASTAPRTRVTSASMIPAPTVADRHRLRRRRRGSTGPSKRRVTGCRQV